MYLHLGQDTVINTDEILGIFDMDNTTVMKASRDYLNSAEKNGDVEYVSYELPKSFVVCRNEKKKSGRVVYICQLSPATIMKRTKNINK